MEKSAYLNPQICGFEPANLRDFLRAKFPRDTAKAAAAVLDESPRTVENWLALRSTPRFRAVGLMIARWGAEFVAEVMTSPPAWACDARVRAEFADLEQRREALQEKLQAGM